LDQSEWGAAFPVLQTSPTGNALAVWVEYSTRMLSTRLMGSLMTPGLGWGSPEEVWIGTGHFSQIGPAVAADGQGGFHVVWKARTSGEKAQDEIWLRHRTPSAWEDPEQIQTSSSALSNVRIGANASGAGFIAWVFQDNTYKYLYGLSWVSLQSRATVQSMRPLSLSINPDEIRVDIVGNGWLASAETLMGDQASRYEEIALYRLGPSSSSRSHAARGPEGTLAFATLASTSTGYGFVAWVQKPAGSSTNLLRAMEFTPSGLSQVMVEVRETARAFGRPRAALTETGRGCLAWSEGRLTDKGLVDGSVLIAQFNRGTGVVDSLQTLQDQTSPYDPQPILKVAGTDGFVLVWKENSKLWATRIPDGSASAPLDTGARILFLTSVAVEADGAALVAWFQQSEEESIPTIQVDRFR